MENRKILISLFEFEDMMIKYFDAGYRMGYDNREIELRKEIHNKAKKLINEVGVISNNNSRSDSR